MLQLGAPCVQQRKLTARSGCHPRPRSLACSQDDKSAANDFQETLERIVNEIKNTTVSSYASTGVKRTTDPPILAGTLRTVSPKSSKSRRARLL